jgi:PII-like signaling protein
MTTLSGPAERLTIYLGESDRHHHVAMHAEIIHRAHAAGMAGASAWKGFEGYGANNHIHTTRILSLSDDLPIMVEIIDTTEKIDAFLPQIRDLQVSGLVVREPIQVVSYGSGPAPDPGAAT